MKTALRVLIVATVLFKAFALLPLASAELNVTCENYSFTEQKQDDCNYILDSNELTDDEKLDLLNSIDQGSYAYEINPIQPVQTSGLNIQTDYLAYKLGDTIKIELFPKDVLIRVTYGDTTKFVKDETTFTALDGIASIKADYQGETFIRDINVRDDPIFLAWRILIFAFFNYFTFSSLTKSSFIAKWLTAVS